MDTAENKSPEIKREDRGSSPVVSGDVRTATLEPDLDFIDALRRRGLGSYKKCIQCGTCAATCTITPDKDPFPQKEMAWALWGLKDRLLRDPDVWLCYQCNDCSTRCPRSARPGELLGAIRRESVIHYSWPRFFGSWVNQAKFIPILLGIPTVLLGLLVLFREPIQAALGVPPITSDTIVFSYSSLFHHRVLNVFFLFFSALAFIGGAVGIRRFWREMNARAKQRGIQPVKSLGSSIRTVLKSILMHDNFALCTKARWRFLSHVLVFFGFLALTMVTIWVITSGVNPLIRREFIYPFNFFSPWKMLANIGGASLFCGCVLMIWSRLMNSEITGSGLYPDWVFVWTLLLVTFTGFATEVLHYFRMEPHRHVIYFIHLVFVFALLIYLPYSKFAHIFYRTTALIFADLTGRSRFPRSNRGKEEQNVEVEDEKQVVESQ